MSCLLPEDIDEIPSSAYVFRLCESKTPTVPGTIGLSSSQLKAFLREAYAYNKKVFTAEYRDHTTSLDYNSRVACYAMLVWLYGLIWNDIEQFELRWPQPPPGIEFLDREKSEKSNKSKSNASIFPSAEEHERLSRIARLENELRTLKAAPQNSLQSRNTPLSCPKESNPSSRYNPSTASSRPAQSIPGGRKTRKPVRAKEMIIKHGQQPKNGFLIETGEPRCDHNKNGKPIYTYHPDAFIKLMGERPTQKYQSGLQSFFKGNSVREQSCPTSTEPNRTIYWWEAHSSQTRPQAYRAYLGVECMKEWVDRGSPGDYFMYLKNDFSRRKELDCDPPVDWKDPYVAFYEAKSEKSKFEKSVAQWEEENEPHARRKIPNARVFRSALQNCFMNWSEHNQHVQNDLIAYGLNDSYGNPLPQPYETWTEYQAWLRKGGV